jgi:hypothetical protein
VSCRRAPDQTILLKSDQTIQRATDALGAGFSIIEASLVWQLPETRGSDISALDQG